MKRFYMMMLLSFALLGAATADEGMWLPSLIQKLNIREMQQMGCELTADDIYNINNSSLKDAVVALDRGSCTAELVSPDGLLLTNHHCGYGEIQAHSTDEHNYLRDGFWAKTRAEELPNPGKSVSFLIRMEDVTDKVMAEVTDQMDFNKRNEAIQKVAAKISMEARANTHYEARVQSLFESNKYYLFVYETFRDIRLVGTPPESVGKFGGDTDNWMWPRHTGDFSMFRVYCSPDGKPADYNEKNVPYHPKHFLPISIKGIEENDFAMVLGYPGNTNRYNSSFGVKYIMEVTNPVRVEVRGVKLAIIDEYMKTSATARIQYSSKYARSSNYWKYSIGQNKGLENLDVIAKKEAIEKQFTEWVNADPVRKAKYGKALDMLKEGYSDLSDDRARSYMAEALLQGPEIFAYANQMQSLERLLDDPSKNSDRIKSVTSRMLSGLDRYFNDYDAATDQKLTAALMKLFYTNIDAKFQPAIFNEIKTKYKGDFNLFASKMFANTIFADKAKMEAFLKNPNLKVLKKDMALQASKSIYDKYSQVVAMGEASQPLLAEGRHLFVGGLMEMNKDKALYPDANSTMRLTYGQVLDYIPRDGVLYEYFTTTKGYLEKEIPGDQEFDVPPRLKQEFLKKDFGRYADADGTLRTCFITTNDITGGNSGSPVINGKGQLIGIAFDGNWEAMSGDVAFEPELQRCINVDIRFVLWIIDKYAGAKNLIDEMTIVQ